jgi:hypothetical protein
MASRRLVLTRSPERFGIIDGATTSQTWPKSVSCRCSPHLVGLSLVAEIKLLVSPRQFRYQYLNGLRWIRDFAYVAHIAVPSVVRNRHRVLVFGTIKGHKAQAMLSHGPPSYGLRLGSAYPSNPRDYFAYAGWATSYRRLKYVTSLTASAESARYQGQDGAPETPSLGKPGYGVVRRENGHNV